MFSPEPSPLAVVLFHIAHPGVFAHVEGMDARVLRRLHPAVVDAAAGDDGDVAVLADEEVVIHHVLQAAHAQHHRDVDRLVFRPRLDDDVDAVLVRLGDDVDVGGGVPARLLAVGPDVVGPLRDLVEPGHLLQ